MASAGQDGQYHELRVARCGDADEAMLHAVSFIHKLGERAHFSTR